MRTWVYIATPFASWFIVGVIKFLINCLREKKLAFDLIGYGGMPSNHSAIVSSIACMVGMREGLDSAPFGVALTLVFIVTMDANSLRRTVGHHAAAINRLANGESSLRERMGHSKLEIIAGIFTGCTTALSLNTLFI
ncbi:acid phosphatase [Limnohabitans sp. MORI2]|uniref:divergent PAP2 family protein n=1 Tax=Limnohabitans sp. MORI2 TaxID=1751150 RepID=UPI00237778FC|nr:divergent PAP2 family protein [Limnohabitans sp. MORI2]BDU57283.1 acid phosphatase [Limnohabitans sp. MORI2]